MTCFKLSQKHDTPGAQATQPQPETRHLVAVPYEHRLRKFSGRQGENELSIDDVIDNAKSAITSRGLPRTSKFHSLIFVGTREKRNQVASQERPKGT